MSESDDRIAHLEAEVRHLKSVRGKLENLREASELLINRMKIYVPDKLPSGLREKMNKAVTRYELAKEDMKLKDGRAVTGVDESTDTSQQVMSPEYLRGFRDARERAAKVAESWGESQYCVDEIRAIEPGVEK